MIAPRTILGRAAILLGLVVALASLTGAAPPQPYLGAGACEPDGTSVVLTDLWSIEREANDYARAWGFSVTLSRVQATGGVSGYVEIPELGDQGPTLCFYVPLATPPRALGPYVQWRTHETVRLLTAVRRARWAD